MRVTAPEGLAIVAAETDADLEAMIAVRTAADPDRTPPRLENLRHHLASDDALTYLVARLDGEPAGCGFVRPWPSGNADAHLVVVPDARRRGIGSALLADLSAHAPAAGNETCRARRGRMTLTPATTSNAAVTASTAARKP